MNPMNCRSIIILLLLVAFVAPPMAVAADRKSEKKEKEVHLPAGIQHAPWDRLLKKLHGVTREYW